MCYSCDALTNGQKKRCLFDKKEGEWYILCVNRSVSQAFNREVG